MKKKMFYIKVKLLLLSFLTFIGLEVFAQTVKLQVPDTALQNKTMLVVMSHLAPIRTFKPAFDNKGNASFLDTCKLADKKSYLAIGKKLVRLYTNVGKVTEIKVGRSQEANDLLFSYKGYASDVYVLQDTIASAYSFSKYFSMVGNNAETVKDYEAKVAMLDRCHQQILLQAQNIKEKSMVSMFAKSNECQYLRYKLALMKVYDKVHQIDVLDDKDYQALLNRIDLNDPEYESYFLITQYLKGKVSSKLEGDPVAWGCEYIKQIPKYITDANMKQQMYLQAIQYVINYAKGDDIDRFWIPFKSVADSAVVKAYEAKVESMKKIKDGMPAYDSEFSDADGHIHRFSEFKGKLLYVDFWATWCGPCKAEIPHLAKLVERYKGNNKVQFISVSVDENVEAWKKMIAKDNPQWLQFVVSKEQNKKISRDWGITGIPRFLLINADGTIYSADAIRPSNPQLISLIDKLIN